MVTDFTALSNDDLQRLAWWAARHPKHTQAGKLSEQVTTEAERRGLTLQHSYYALRCSVPDCPHKALYRFGRRAFCKHHKDIAVHNRLVLNARREAAHRDSGEDAYFDKRDQQRRRHESARRTAKFGHKRPR